jgi:predicted ArsR family transcriptional regulator
MELDGVPTDGRSLDTADALRAVVALRQLADQLEQEYVERALISGWSWAQVAEALNVTRQAVHKKHFPRLEATGVVTRKRDNRA